MTNGFVTDKFNKLKELSTKKSNQKYKLEGTLLISNLNEAFDQIFEDFGLEKMSNSLYVYKANPNKNGEQDLKFEILTNTIDLIDKIALKVEVTASIGLHKQSAYKYIYNEGSRFFIINKDAQETKKYLADSQIRNIVEELLSDLKIRRD